MTTLVVGGHSRNIGKTSVAAGLIGAFAELGWTALKITQYGHGICSINGRECGCAVEEHAHAVTEERDAAARSDTARFLAAGARRSFWVRTKQGQLESALPEVLPLVGSARYVMIESNSILRFLDPDLYIVVLGYGVSDFKPSALEFLGRADAAVAVGDPRRRPAWAERVERVLGNVPSFRAAPPEYVPQGLVDFVASRLRLCGRGSARTR